MEALERKAVKIIKVNVPNCNGIVYPRSVVDAFLKSNHHSILGTFGVISDNEAKLPKPDQVNFVVQNLRIENNWLVGDIVTQRTEYAVNTMESSLKKGYDLAPTMTVEQDEIGEGGLRVVTNIEEIYYVAMVPKSAFSDIKQQDFTIYDFATKYDGASAFDIDEDLLIEDAMKLEQDDDPDISLLGEFAADLNEKRRLFYEQLEHLDINIVDVYQTED